jgi:hypothetical protein
MTPESWSQVTAVVVANTHNSLCTMHTYVVLRRITEQRQVRYGNSGTFQPGRHDSVRSGSYPLWQRTRLPETSIARDHSLPESWPAKQIKDLH